MKLTQRAIEAMTYQGKLPKGSDRRWDSDLKGFGVNVWPTGAKTYFIAYRHQGRLRFMTLGSNEVLNLVQARDIAKLRLADVIAGDDPLALRNESKRGRTMADLCEAYIDRHARKKKSGIDDVRMIRSRILKRIGTRRIDSIKRAEIAQWHHEMTIAGHPTGANRLMSLLSKMFNCAIKWGFLPDNATNPATLIDRNEEKERKRILEPEEVRALLTAIHTEGKYKDRKGVERTQGRDPFFEALVWLYLLLGNRKSELLKLKWSDVDLGRRTICFVDTKNGTEHTLPLSSPAVQILFRLPRFEGNPWVFPGRVPKTRRRSIQGAWNAIRARTGLQDVWLHDLRRTVGSALGNTGHADNLIGKVLNNSAEVAGKHYVHLNLSPIAAALEAHASALVLVAEAGDAEPASPLPAP